MNFSRKHHSIKRQNGAAFIVMLVIMIMGVTIALVGALSSSNLHISRDKKTADVLAQAREALIARAVTDISLPGSLPCPSNPISANNDGVADSMSGSDCPYYIGRLPWKTLGLPKLTDGDGAPLWYALSRNFRDDNLNNLNSDSSGTLIITGSPSANKVAAIVFAPGASINGQSRSDTQTGACTTGGSPVESLCAANYLEGSNANPSPKASPNTQYIAGDSSNSFNDHLIFITTENLLPNVEKRIAREIKQCLDDYSTVSSNKYPWAAPVSPLGYATTSNTLFGRVPDQPTINTTIPVGSSSDPNIVALLDALTNLQTAVNSCQSNDTLQAALTSAGNTLLGAISSITNPPFTSTFINKATAAGNAAINNIAGNTSCDYIQNHHTNADNNPVQTNLNSANSALSSITVTVPEDVSMQMTWPATCILSSPVAAYWSNWKEMVFYRVSNAYRPFGTKICGTSCLSVSGNGNPNQGSGSYRAAVIVAGKNLTQTARVPTSINSYLEGMNSGVAGTTTLETWQLSEQQTKTINDFVVCVDGKGADQNSKCY